MKIIIDIKEFPGGPLPNCEVRIRSEGMKEATEIEKVFAMALKPVIETGLDLIGGNLDARVTRGDPAKG